MSTTTVQLDATTVAELEAIDNSRRIAFEAVKVMNREGMTSDFVVSVMEAFDAVDARCRELHRRIWPTHHGHLVVVNGEAFLVSPTGRSIRKVWAR